MNETEIKLMFPTEKLDALRYFMGRKEMTIEQEMKEYLDKAYEKTVPAHVREYVESRLEQNTAQEAAVQQEAQAQQTPQTERQSRQSRRQREQAADANACSVQHQTDNATTVEEENQGMSMSI